MIWKNILGIKCLVSDMEIFSKRKQLKKFSERAPSKELVQTILRKTFELTPSKQNMMPYNVHVLDHTHTKEKDILYKLSTHSNCYHNYQLKAPYVLLLEPRKVEATEHMKSELFEKHGGYLNVRASDVDVEIGMFATIFTGLCLEYDIEVSYTKCFPEFTQLDLLFLESSPTMAISIGYRIPDRVYKDTRHIKPKLSDVIKWVDSP